MFFLKKNKTKNELPVVLVKKNHVRNETELGSGLNHLIDLPCQTKFFNYS
jgi:hypothetical protein